jgi:hypothetical protein
MLPQTVDINNVQFANPASNAFGETNENISMTYVTLDDLGKSDMSVPQYVYVTSYNGTAGDNFQVFYSQTPSPTGTPPPGARPRPGIVGLVLPM